MTAVNFDFESGSNGTTATAANTGLDTVTAGSSTTITFRTAAASGSSMGLRIAKASPGVSTDTLRYNGLQGGATGSSVRCAMDIGLSASPGGAFQLAYWTDSANGTLLPRVILNSNRTVSVQNAANSTIFTTATAIPTDGTKYRVELVWKPGTSSTTGTIGFGIAPATDAVVNSAGSDYFYATNVHTGTSDGVGRWNFGHLSSGVLIGNIDLDNVRADDTTFTSNPSTWLGSVAPPPTTVTGVTATATAAAPAGATSAGSRITGATATASATASAGTARVSRSVTGATATATASATGGQVFVGTLTIGVTATATAAASAGTLRGDQILTGATGTAAATSPAGSATVSVSTSGVTATATAATDPGVPHSDQRITGSPATATAAGHPGSAVVDLDLTGATATATALSPAGAVRIIFAITGATAAATAAAAAGAASSGVNVTGVRATATATALAGFILVASRYSFWSGTFWVPTAAQVWDGQTWRTDVPVTVTQP